MLCIIQTKMMFVSLFYHQLSLIGADYELQKVSFMLRSSHFDIFVIV